MRQRKMFVIADLHFGHANVMKYSPSRMKFIGADETTLEPEVIFENELIAQWNSVVLPQDIVYVLGDFTLSRNKLYISSLLERLNGAKVLVRGNHDTLKTEDYINLGFETVVNGALMLRNHKIFFSHEPMPHEVIPEGWFNFFGHVHEITDFNWERGMCVSVEQINFTPYCIEKFLSRY